MALNTESHTRFRFEIYPVELIHRGQATCRDLQHKINEKYGLWPVLYDGSRKLKPHEMPLMTTTSEGRTVNLRMVLREDPIKLTVENPDGSRIQYLMLGAQSIGKMMKKHCEHCDFSLRDVIFLYNWASLEPEATLQSLSMTDGDSVHVLWKDASKRPKVPLLDSSANDVGEEAKGCNREDVESH